MKVNERHAASMRGWGGSVQSGSVCIHIYRSVCARASVVCASVYWAYVAIFLSLFMLAVVSPASLPPPDAPPSGFSGAELLHASRTPGRFYFAKLPFAPFYEYQRQGAKRDTVYQNSLLRLSPELGHAERWEPAK